ncbi:DUF4365 domain-containing protein [Microlunatus antarcticus]|uniref:DUF4365 domain-containing protein n=1 Tax=Microlunatus antarcticus TaxID=53388 RepID=A0A7W5JSG3_9ACTN|nr:hypothetical protein [Microlunatus antarcticus]
MSTLAGFPDGMRSVLQGDFGESWLSVVAAGAGLSHGPHATTDLLKADIQLTLREEVEGVFNPSVLVQVKTTNALRDDGEEWAYDLDVSTYNVLQNSKERLRRILVVIGVAEDGETTRSLTEGTLLVGQSAWVSLEGAEATKNKETCVVRLPKANTLDEAGLRKMLKTFGVPQSTVRGFEELWQNADYAWAFPGEGLAQ